MEFCCYVWAGAPSCYLEFSDKLQKQICRIVGPSFATSFELVAHCRSVASLYDFCRCLSELAQLVLLPYSSSERSNHYSDSLHVFPVNIPRCYKNFYVKHFFLCTARLWNSLPIECFPFTYVEKSRISRHLLTVGSF